MLCQGIVNTSPQLLPMRRLCLIAQPLVISFSMRLWIFHNGQSVFNADGITQPANSLSAAPKVPKFPVTVQIDRRPDNVIMDVRFINMGTDDKCVFALGKPVGKLHSQPVGFLCGDLAGTEGLPDMIGNHIVRSPHPPGGRNVLALCQQKLGIGHPAVTFIAGNQFAVVCLLWVCYIVDDVADCLTFRAAFADVQRHDACGCHEKSSLSSRYLYDATRKLPLNEFQSLK